MVAMGEEFTRKVAAEIRAEMARQQMSQDQLADRIGMSQSTLSRRLTGSLPFDTTELAKVAEALGVVVTALLPNPKRRAA
jgi:transcriptional regulator with XRE-family HTH domain